MNVQLSVALDDLAARESETLASAKKLSAVASPFGFKINLDYVLKIGLDELLGQYRCHEGIFQFGRRIFFDLKMWNGTRTMASIAERLVGLDAAYLNAYSLADEELRDVVAVCRGTQTKILAVTVLTHYDEAYCRNHFRRSLRATVRHLALTAIESGCQGIIIPGTALDGVRDLDTIKVVPGVRPRWYKDSRHEQEVEPYVAAEKGADIVVCGSPIMKAQDPVSALKEVLEEMDT